MSKSWGNRPGVGMSRPKPKRLTDKESQRNPSTRELLESIEAYNQPNKLGQEDL